MSAFHASSMRDLLCYGPKWRVQVIEPTPRPPSIPTLIDFWKSLRRRVEWLRRARADHFGPARGEALRA